MLFKGSRALMMIIIIINGTARELTNNGEQMIPSWPQKKKKRSVPVPAMPYEAKEGPQPSLGLKFSCSSHVQIVPPATLSSFIFFYRFLNYVNKV